MLNQRSRYALRALIFIARSGGVAPVPISVIAADQQLPRKFLEAILLDLKNGGVVNSYRGKMGGYRLARPASQISFGEIIRLVLINWFDFTNGPQGITVPKATFFGLPFKAGDDGFAAFFGIEHNRIHYYVFLYYVILLLALLTYFVTNRLRRLPIGRASCRERVCQYV